jgi:hypothetical protein
MLFKIHCLENKKPILGRICIAALPKQVLDTIPIFRPFRPLFNKIVCTPLCRIYSRFSNKDPWFKKLPKLTTNNQLRMILPYNTKEGTIMLSYSDNIFAEYWKKIYDTKGVDAVNRELVRLTKQSIGVDIPTPLQTKVFFWECGVGNWGVGANSEYISQKMIQPFDNIQLFVCGEHFSEKNQQWIEGALETSIQVLHKIEILFS